MMFCWLKCERQIWVWGMRLNFVEISMGKGRQVMWYFKLSEMESSYTNESWKGHEILRDPLQTAENIEN